MSQPASYKTYASYFFSALCLVVLLDFILPGRAFEETVREANQQREEYYNAAQGYHYSYSISTVHHTIDLPEDLYRSDLIGTTVNYRVSLIFREINQFQIVDQAKTTNSLRYYSGLIVPLLVLLIGLFSLRYPKRLDILVFVTQVVLLGDLIYLLQ